MASHRICCWQLYTLILSDNSLKNWYWKFHWRKEQNFWLEKTIFFITKCLNCSPVWASWLAIAAVAGSSVSNWVFSTLSQRPVSLTWYVNAPGELFQPMLLLLLFKRPSLFVICLFVGSPMTEILVWLSQLIFLYYCPFQSLVTYL